MCIYICIYKKKYIYIHTHIYVSLDDPCKHCTPRFYTARPFNSKLPNPEAGHVPAPVTPLSVSSLTSHAPYLDTARPI